METKKTLKDLVLLLAAGIGSAVMYHGAIATVALMIGMGIAAFSDLPWLIAWLFVYLGLRLLLEGIDAFSGPKSTKCPECRQKIQTTNPVKCVECGGPALLVKKRGKENRSRPVSE